MDVKEVLKNLVHFDTCEDKQNKEIMNYIEELLKDKGFKTEYRSKCLVMTINEGFDLGFIGHTDTVRAGKAWTFNPLELNEIDKKLYGLGTCDMKGGVAAIIKAVIDTEWKKMNGGIKLIFTYDEEIGFEGIKEILNQNISIPENVMIGEPTNNLIMNGSKGLIEFKLKFKGKSVHSSIPSKGKNAIQECINCLNELNSFYNNLKQEIDTRFEVPYTTMNIGKIQGGCSINIVPDYCDVEIDFRLLNGNHRERIINRIIALQEKYDFEYNIINDILPFISDSAIVNTTNYITEASFIQSKNRMILGPGPINAHEPNEYITIDSLERLVKQYKELIIKYCK